VGAQIEWLEVQVSLRIMIHYSNQTLDSSIHSVSCITARTGEKFVTDFTVEQFGYDDTFWFMKKDEDLTACTTNGECCVASDSEIASIAQDHAERDYEHRLTETLRAVRDDLGWSTLDNLPAGQRLAWVRSRTVDLLEGWEKWSDILEIADSHEDSQNGQLPVLSPSSLSLLSLSSK
jgi:hypothetical protein